MVTFRYTPGPAAAEAFMFGIATAITISLAGFWLLLWTDMLTLFGAILAVVVGLPVLLLVVSCLLSMWLGYNRDAYDVALS
jgi:hypothetical protein